MHRWKIQDMKRVLEKHIFFPEFSCLEATILMIYWVPFTDRLCT